MNEWIGATVNYIVSNNIENNKAKKKETKKPRVV